MSMYTLLDLKWTTNKDLLYSKGNSVHCYLAAWMEGELGENEYMHMYGWIRLLSTWNYHNTVNQLYFNIKLNVFFLVIVFTIFFPQIYISYCILLPHWLPRWLRGKESTCQCRRHGFNLWAGKIPWRRAWWSTSVFLAWRIPWTEEPGRLQFMGSCRLRHDWVCRCTLSHHITSISYNGDSGHL